MADDVTHSALTRQEMVYAYSLAEGKTKHESAEIAGLNIGTVNAHYHPSTRPDIYRFVAEIKEQFANEFKSLTSLITTRARDVIVNGTPDQYAKVSKMILDWIGPALQADEESRAAGKPSSVTNIFANIVK